jgi:hypothetical protein
MKIRDINLSTKVKEHTQEVEDLYNEVQGLFSVAVELEKKVFNQESINDKLNTFYEIIEYKCGELEALKQTSAKLKNFIEVANSVDKYTSKMRMAGISIGKFEILISAHTDFPVVLDLRRMNIQAFKGKAIEFGKIGNGNVNMSNWIFSEISRNPDIMFDFRGINYVIQSNSFFNMLFGMIHDGSVKKSGNNMIIDSTELSEGLYTRLKADGWGDWEIIKDRISILHQYFLVKTILEVDIQGRFKVRDNSEKDNEIYSLFEKVFDKYVYIVDLGRVRRSNYNFGPTFRTEELVKESDKLISNLTEILCKTSSITNKELISTNPKDKKYVIDYNPDYIKALSENTKPLNHLARQTEKWINSYYEI